MKRFALLLFVCSVGMSAVAAAASEENATEALFSAIRAADPAGIRSAIAAGAPANAKDKDGTPALMYAAVVSDAATMRLLLDQGADPNLANAAGATALIYAAGDPAKATLLISRGAKVDVQSGPGATPLLAASSSDGNAAIVRLMIAKGAAVNVHDRIQGIPALLSGGGSTPPVLAAARLQNSDTLRALLAAGAEVNAKDANGATALSDAVLYSNTENVRILLGAGAGVNFLIGGWKQTPLIAAAMHHNAEIVRMLLDAGASVDARDASDSTALMWAAYSEYGDTAVVSALLAAGADVNHKNKWGESALTWAKRRGETAVVAMLRKAGAESVPMEAEGVSITATGASELPAIHTAVEKGLAPLQALGGPSFKKTGCISCHNALLPMTVAGTARDRGFSYNAAQLAENRKIVEAFVGPAVEPMREGLDLIPDIPITGGYALEALHAAGTPSNAITDALVHRIARAQNQDGRWVIWAPRPPIEYSDVTATALAIRSLVLYGPPGRRQEFQERIARAGRWLESVPVRTSEERNMRLLGLTWAHAKPDVIRAAVQAVVALQRADGGWSSLDSLESDAYATGQTLYALHEAGAAEADACYRRGIVWLTQTQEPDGSWHVKTRAFPFQPLVDTGYGHGRDQWISSQASAWALLALMFAEPEPAKLAQLGDARQ